MIPTLQRGNPQGNNFPHCHRLCGIEMKTAVVTCSPYGSPEQILPVMQHAGLVQNSAPFVRWHDVFVESSVSFGPSDSYLRSLPQPQTAESIAAILSGTQRDNPLYLIPPATAATHRADGRLTIIGTLFGATTSDGTVGSATPARRTASKQPTLGDPFRSEVAALNLFNEHCWQLACHRMLQQKQNKLHSKKSSRRKRIRLSDSNCTPKSTYFKPRSISSLPLISRSN